MPKDKSFLSAWATKARFDETTRVEDHPCYRLVCERDTQPWIIYVEKESKLIRRIDSEVSEAQMRRLRKLGWGGGASGRVIASADSLIFHVDELTWKKNQADEPQDEQ